MVAGRNLYANTTLVAAGAISYGVQAVQTAGLRRNTNCGPNQAIPIDFAAAATSINKYSNNLRVIGNNAVANLQGMTLTLQTTASRTNYETFFVSGSDFASADYLTTCKKKRKNFSFF